MLGRMVQVDPMAIYTHDMTPYHYAGNTPVGNNDPSGALMEAVIGDYGRYAPGILGNYQIGFGGWAIDYGGTGGGGGSAAYSGSPLSNGMVNNSHDTNRWTYINIPSPSQPANGGADGGGGGGGGGAVASNYGGPTLIVPDTGERVSAFDVATCNCNQGSRFVDRAYDAIADWMASQVGTLYSNETDAYRDMWNNSFINGKPSQENYAFLTGKGVFVLPTSGIRKSTGKYAANGPSEGYSDYVNTKKVGNQWFVENGDSWLEIIGSVHTHPNDSGSGLSPADAGNIIFGPVIAFQSNYYYYGYMQNGIVVQGYTKGSVVSDGLSLIGLLKMLPR